ncbi:MAG: bifunctional demethylmenaquinone methyltransferase/2-methoxy-6-polyprenyl-1,4-benzoquinol methylase UbiE [Bacteroidetes bacterium]|nr:bifunctional demethylmenaquinone methyltransferase/2-methoxy-6-polyprenyl-1,4-benzoquinol methylase UbiE [Bacteroidota bacterium]
MNKPPIQQAPGRKEQVKGMFDSIAGRYDFLNHFLSLGIDKGWRKKLVKLMAEEKPQHILDLATGTADLAIEAIKLNPAQVTGTDISGEMLSVGREKVKKLGLYDRITLLQADSENLPFETATFDAAMVAFGVRNYENLPKGLSEMNRVLKPGSKAFILEFSKPTAFPVKQFYSMYFRFILPLIGRLVSKHSSAYTYLPESVNVFPQADEFLEIMKRSGFKDVKYMKLTFGITMLYIGNK